LETAAQRDVIVDLPAKNTRPDYATAVVVVSRAPNNPVVDHCNPKVVVEAGTACSESVSQLQELNCLWNTCTADMPYRIDAVLRIPKPDLRWRLPPIPQEARSQHRLRRLHPQHLKLSQLRRQDPLR